MTEPTTEQMLLTRIQELEETNKVLLEELATLRQQSARSEFQMMLELTRKVDRIERLLRERPS